MWVFKDNPVGLEQCIGEVNDVVSKQNDLLFLSYLALKEIAMKKSKKISLKMMSYLGRWGIALIS